MTSVSGCHTVQRHREHSSRGFFSVLLEQLHPLCSASIRFLFETRAASNPLSVLRWFPLDGWGYCSTVQCRPHIKRPPKRALPSRLSPRPRIPRRKRNRIRRRRLPLRIPKILKLIRINAQPIRMPRLQRDRQNARGLIDPTRRRVRAGKLIPVPHKRIPARVHRLIKRHTQLLKPGIDVGRPVVRNRLNHQRRRRQRRRTSRALKW